MTFEEKLRRAASWAGLAAGALGAMALPTKPVVELDQSLVALGLALAGIALWLEGRGSTLAWRRIFAALALACALGALLKLAHDGTLSLDALSLRDSESGPMGASPRRLPHAPLALAVAAVALFALRRTVWETRRPLATLLACLVIATASAALIVNGLQPVVTFPPPLQISSSVALALLAIGAGTLLARPGDKLLQILFSSTVVGSLARRLFYGLTLLPTVLIGAVVIAIQSGVITQRSGITLLVLGLILSGLMLAFLSVNNVVSINLQREESDRARLLLTAQLQEQAARLQETVGLRTRELREANTQLLAVAETNTRLALVAQHATDGVVITDAEGRIEWINAAFQRMTGYAVEELTGCNPGHVFEGPDTAPATVARLREAVAAGTACHVEILNYTKNRRAYWQEIDLQPVHAANGRVTHFISIHTDITEKRAATERLLNLNQRLAVATRAAALGVWEWDAATHISQWDDRTLEIYGLPRSDYHGRSADWEARIHPDDRSVAVATTRSLIRGADESDHCYRILRLNDGAVRYIHSRSTAQRDAAGHLLRIIGTERDITDERESIQQTDALNKRLRLALRSSNFGVWELDLVTGQRHWDDRMLEIYGVRREAFHGANPTWLEPLHPEDRARAEAYTHSVVIGELPAYDTAFRIVHTDGSVRYIESHGYLQREADGRPVRLVGLNRDVTGEKQLQQALDLAEQRWQLAVESTNDGVWDWDLQTGTVYHDERWAGMLGYDRDEVAPNLGGWRRLVHPEDLSSCDAAAREHHEGRTAFYRHEHRMLAKNGQWRWILDRGKVVRRDSTGRPLRMVGTHTDITARKELEERLRRTETFGDQISRIALIGGWELNLETSEIIWSENTRRLHEVDDAFVPTDSNLDQFYPAGGLDLIRAARCEATPANPGYDLELPMVTARQTHRWVRVISLVKFREGVAVAVMGAIQDITTRHESEAARRKLEDQLFQAQKMETLGTLAGGIAHDFNNLLTGIIGFHELAADTVPADHPARFCLTEAHNASLRARELIAQILTFGRHSPGGGHVTLDAGLVVEEAHRFLRATVPANVSIECHLEPHCPDVSGDATQLHQVLLNLGSNAAHAMRPHGGTLMLGLESTNVSADLAASLGGLAAGTYVRLAVTDTGQGMDDATRRRIFDPFFTTKNAREGTGLGLAVVHGIVRSHRGAIDVTSTPGRGTTFHVYLPVATDGRFRDETELTAAPQGSGEFVCIVDDEELIANCTQLVLENKGYRAVRYDSAEDCLEALCNDPAGCSLLITDQTMPGMQGTDLVKKLRANNPRLPVVIMSGYFSKIPPNVLDELGHVELLSKPFTTNELASAVHRALHAEQKDTGRLRENRNQADVAG